MFLNYLKIISFKTAALIASACQSGAILGGLSEDFEKSLKDYGQYKVKEVEFNGRPLTSVQNELSEFLLERSWIEKSADEINLAVKLG